MNKEHYSSVLVMFELLLEHIRESIITGDSGEAISFTDDALKIIERLKKGKQNGR